MRVDSWYQRREAWGLLSCWFLENFTWSLCTFSVGFVFSVYFPCSNNGLAFPETDFPHKIPKPLSLLIFTMSTILRQIDDVVDYHKRWHWWQSCESRWLNSGSIILRMGECVWETLPFWGKWVGAIFPQLQKGCRMHIGDSNFLDHTTTTSSNLLHGLYPSRPLARYYLIVVK